MSLKIRLVLLAVLISATALGVAWGQRGYRMAADAARDRDAIATQLRDANASLASMRAAEKRRQELEAKRVDTTAQQTARATQTRKDLNHATETSPEWASTPVPDSVWDAILTGPYAPRPAP